MDVYKIVKVDNDGFLHWLKLEGINPEARKILYVSFYNEAGFFRVGDVIKRYVGQNSNLMAESYKLGRYKFVNLYDVPKTEYDIEHFYADLDFCDRIRLQYDVAQALKSYGIKTSWGPKSNLRKLVFETQKTEKVR